MGATVTAARYRLDERLGAGGMAEVWSAEDLELGRRVALKLLGRDADPARFEREAHAAATLSHPNICQIYGYGETGGRPYMVLEYLPGGTLEDRLATGAPLPDADSARIATEIAEALAHAHARGLVHRDLKPANVLFDAEDRAKIADFGIARIGGAGTLTEAGTILGTAAYISPEQASGEPATPASDVYSFGVILYRMLAGRLPFESENAIALALQHRHSLPPPLARVRADVPPLLESLAAPALAKDPADRPADGAALVTELRGLPEGAPTEVVRPRRGRRAKRTRRVALVAALLLFAGAGALLALLAIPDSSSPTRPAPLPSRTVQEAPPAAPATGAEEPAAATTAEERTPTGPATTREEAAPTTTEPLPTTTLPPTTTPPTTTATEKPAPGSLAP